MKLSCIPPFRTLAVSTLLAAALVQPSPAQNATTDPVGVTTVNLIAGNATSPPTQYLGLGLSKGKVFQGKVATIALVSGTTRLTFSSGSITDNAFDPVNGYNTHFIEVLDGAGAGAVSDVVVTDADAVTLSDDLSAVITAGTTKVCIRKFWTVADAFGATNTAGFLGGATSGVADVLTISRPDYASIDIFYNTSASQWQTVAGAANANNIPIPVDAGLYVLRRGTSTASFKIFGDVKLGSTALWVDGSTTEKVTLLQNLYPLGSVMLKDSGLYTGNNTTGVQGGTSATSADLVTIQDPQTGVSNQFFFDTTSQCWKTGFTDASLIKIPENASIAVTRRANRPAFTWYSPQPLMALSDAPLPLTLVSAVSRKTHGTAGTWDVNLPINGAGSTLGVECRSGGASGNHTVIFTFSGASAIDPITGTGNPITAASVSVSSGVGSIVGSPVLDGDKVFVNLTGVSNKQTLNLQIASVQAQNGQTFASASVPMGVLLADSSYNRAVNSSDAAQSQQASSPGTLSFANFRTDVTLNGAINSSDAALIRSQSGNSIP